MRLIGLVMTVVVISAAPGSVCAGTLVGMLHAKTVCTNPDPNVIRSCYGGELATQSRQVSAWLNRTEAIANTYIYTGTLPPTGSSLYTDPPVTLAEWILWTQTVLTVYWEQGNVPVISYISPAPAEVNSGTYDRLIGNFARAMYLWLSGPDGTYGNDDDRRAYIRLDWEANGNWFPWSPCAGPKTTAYPLQNVPTTAADYRAMWRRYHGIFANNQQPTVPGVLSGQGIDNKHLAWIFSVNADDVCYVTPCPSRVGGDATCGFLQLPVPAAASCSPSTIANHQCDYQMEQLYPGDDVVDWVGMDGYAGISQVNRTPSQTFSAMAARLRTKAPSKPLSINEVGVDDSVTGGKSQWIADYFAWVHDNDVRMSSWFNIDKESNWAVWNGIEGDETFNGTKAWAAYRVGAGQSWVIPSDVNNKRLLTDAQFLGQ